ncbi:hypothetical protein OSCI_3360024 [Kamptonema sp. PCC 6506]|nr:hypothetical protein OSCI_3360024 [Kamptonema sp. PCC 6506]
MSVQVLNMAVPPCLCTSGYAGRSHSLLCKTRYLWRVNWLFLVRNAISTAFSLTFSSTIPILARVDFIVKLFVELLFKKAYNSDLEGKKRGTNFWKANSPSSEG